MMKYDNKNDIEQIEINGNMLISLSCLIISVIILTSSSLRASLNIIFSSIIWFKLLMQSHGKANVGVITKSKMREIILFIAPPFINFSLASNCH